MATTEPSSSIDAETMDSLLLACSSGNSSSLEQLLSSPIPRRLALSKEERQYNFIRLTFPSLHFLLEHGGDPNTRCAGYRAHGYYLRYAARKLPLEYTSLLLEYGAIVSESGAMQMAVEKGRLDLLKQLVEHGGNVNERVDHNIGFFAYKTKKQQASETLLHIAVKAGYVEIAKWLLEQGADAALVDLKGENAVELAKRTGNEEMREIFGQSETA